MCCSSPPPPPDYSALAEGSIEAAELAPETAMAQLDWAREQWTSQREVLDQILGPQIQAMEEQFANAREDRARYEEVYQPIEDNLIAEFMSYDTPERQEMEAGRAASDVTRAFQAQRDNAQRQLEAYGIDPSQTRSQAIDATIRGQEAASQAAAQNQARTRVEDVGRSLRGEAINIGRGMPSQVASSYGQAIQSGNSAVGNQNQTVATGSGAMGNPTQWYGNVTGGYQTAGNMLNMGYNNALSGWQAGQAASPWNTIIGIGGKVLTAGLADGGEVSGPGGPRGDAIPAQLSDGEYIVPAHVVRQKGTDFFDKLKATADEKEQQKQALAQNVPTPQGMAQALPAVEAPSQGIPNKRIG
jgi:hypothetical protein